MMVWGVGLEGWRRILDSQGGGVNPLGLGRGIIRFCARSAPMVQSDTRFSLGLLMLVLAALVWSGWAPHDRATWWMEVAPVFIAAPLLILSYPRFPFTRLVQVLIALHALVLIVGGAWTYAEVPLGFWLQDWLELSRNPYDKIGHWMQGFVPALVAREILIRKGVVRGQGWLFFLVTCICLAISALYELIEWQAAVMMGQGADAFLGTQGDPWDTQSDMATAWFGAMAAQLLLGRWQDGALARYRRWML